MTAIELIAEYRQAFVGGLVVTLQLSGCIWTIGITLGTLLGSLASQWPTTFGVPLRLASFFFSSVPVLALLVWAHYPLQALLGIVTDGFYTTVAVLSTLNVALVSDLVRGVLIDFPRQYIDSARVCGLGRKDTVLYVQLPLILRQVLPGMLMIQVSMLQATLFGSLISVDELFRVAQQVNSRVYRPVEIYTALGIFYLVICAPLNGAALVLRKRFTRDLSER